MTTKQDARVEAATQAINEARYNDGKLHDVNDEGRGSQEYARRLAHAALAAADRVMGGTDQEDAARNAAFAILKRHPDCLRDDVVFNDLIDDIAANIGPSPDTTAAVEAAVKGERERMQAECDQWKHRALRAETHLRDAVAAHEGSLATEHKQTQHLIVGRLEAEAAAIRGEKA